MNGLAVSAETALLNIQQKFVKQINPACFFNHPYLLR